VRLTEAPPGDGEFSQQYIDGEHYSVSLVAGRVVGEACLYFTGAPPLVLALNRQFITIGPDGAFRYEGGETPVHVKREAEIAGIAKKAVTVLGCQGYCGVDLVVADKPYVVDVNPRITTSLVGISAVMEEEIAQILVDVSLGKELGGIHFRGRVRYDTHGTVMPA